MLRIYALIVLVTICGVLAANNYNLEQLIEISLEHSAELNMEIESNKISSSYLRSSILDLLPSAEVVASKTRVDKASWKRESGLTISAYYEFDLPKIFSIYSAILSKKSASLSLVHIKKFVVYSIFYQYSQVLEYQKSLEIQTGNYQLQEKIYNQIMVQYEIGEKSLLDLQQSEITLIDYEIAMLEIRNALINSRKNLFQYLNIKDDGYDFDDLNIADKEINFDYKPSISLIQKKNTMKKNNLSLWQKRLDYLPTFHVYYNYQFLNQDNNLAYDDYDNYDIDSKSLTVGASFSLTGIFETNEKHWREFHKYKISRIDYLDSKSSLENELHNLENNYNTLKKSRDLYAKKLDLAEKNLVMAQQQYSIGMISLLDMDRSQLEFSQAQLSYNNRYFELLRKQEEVNLLRSEKILDRW